MISSSGSSQRRSSKEPNVYSYAGAATTSSVRSEMSGPSPGSGKINIALLTERNIHCMSTGL